MEWEETKAFLAPCFPEEIRAEMEMLYPGELREIRVRADKPTVFRTAGRTAQLGWTPTARQVEALAEGIQAALQAVTEKRPHADITVKLLWEQADAVKAGAVNMPTTSVQLTDAAKQMPAEQAA